SFASKLASGLSQLGFEIAHQAFFDTIRLELGEMSSREILARTERSGCNLRRLGPHSLGISMDETTTDADLEVLMAALRGANVRDFEDDQLAGTEFQIPQSAARSSDFLMHPVFNTHDTETEMRGYGGVQGCADRVFKRWRYRSCRSTRQSGRARARSRRVNGNISFDPRRFRNDYSRNLRNRTRARWPGLHGWREHERTGRPLPP